MPRRPIPNSKDAKKAELSRKSKRELIIIETHNSESSARNDILVEAATEFTELQKLYEVESRRTKDNYILTLERRYAAFRSQTQSRMDAMEANFTSVLAAISRMLTDAHSVGAASIGKGATFAERNSKQSQASPASIIGTISFGSVSTSQQQQVDPTEEKIRKFFTNAAAGETKLDMLNCKEMCSRLDELRETVVGLVSFAVKRLRASRQRIHQLEAALSDQTTHLVSSEKLLLGALSGGGGPVSCSGTVRLPSAGALRTTGGGAGGGSSAPISGASNPPVRSIHREAIELCRELGQRVREELDSQRQQLKAALDALLDDSMDLCHRFPNQDGTPSKLSGGGLPSHPLKDFYKEACVEDFCSKLDAMRVQQAGVFRMIRDRMTALETERLSVDSIETAKLLRTNIPEPQREMLHTSTEAFDRDALLQLLDRLSFEPTVAETIIAVVNKYDEVKHLLKPTTLNEDESHHNPDGLESSAAAAAVVALGESASEVPILTRPVVLKKKVANAVHHYTTAINAMAVKGSPLPPSSSSPKTPPPSSSAVAVVSTPGSAAKDRFTYSAFDRAQSKSPHGTKSDDRDPTNQFKTPLLVPHPPPAPTARGTPPPGGSSFARLEDSGLLPLNSSPLHYAAASHFPEVAGVTIPADYLFASPLSKKFVNSEGRRRAEAQQLFRRAKENDETAMQGDRSSHLSPRARRQELLSVFLDDGPDEEHDEVGGHARAAHGDVHAMLIATKLNKASARLESVKAGISSSSAATPSPQQQQPLVKQSHPSSAPGRQHTTGTSVGSNAFSSRREPLPASARLYSEKLRTLLADFE